MNDIKTSERSVTQAEATLKHLMLWHSLAKDLSCEQLPVMAILKEFRELGGVRGRKAHRGTMPPNAQVRVPRQGGGQRRRRRMSVCVCQVCGES
jgi:hypothetical protein